jgi:glutathione S-transferase
MGLLRQSKQALRIMDDHMTLREFDGGIWFVGLSATIADLALFPAIALSRDYGVDHEAYPALRRWIRKIRHLPGFLTMPGVPDYY